MILKLLTAIIENDAIEIRYWIAEIASRGIELFTAFLLMYAKLLCTVSPAVIMVCMFVYYKKNERIELQ